MMYGDMQHQLGNNIMQQQQHLPQLQQQQLNQQQMAQQHHMNQQQMSPASSASGYSPVQEPNLMNKICFYSDSFNLSYIWSIGL